MRHAIGSISFALVTISVAGCGLGDDAASDDPRFGSDEQALNGDKWTTVEDNPYQGNGAQYYGIAISPSDYVYAVGSRSEPNGGPLGLTTWLVRFALQGNAWSLGDAYTLAPGRSAEAVSVAVDAQNRVFVVGDAHDANGHQHWITRMWQFGLGWQTVDDYAPTNFGAGALGIAIDDATGEIVVSGYYETDNSIGEVWKVRSSGDGINWIDADTVTGAPHELTTAAGSCFNGGSFFTVGGEAPNATTDEILVRKANLNATGWANAETLSPNGSSNASLGGCGGPDNGPLFTAGFYAVGLNYHWFVQRSDNNGQSFITVDDVALNPYSYAKSVRAGANGAIYVLGERTPSTPGGSQWYVRRSTNGAPFVDSDIGGVPGQYASASAFKYRTGVGGFAAGYVVDVNGVSHGIVRRVD